MPVSLGKKEKGGSTVSIQENARRRHLAAFGKSGSGKTTLLTNAVLADLSAGNGVTVVDPHGAMVEDILNSIPPSSYERCHLYKPSSSNTSDRLERFGIG